ncbi:MAG: TonB-dependent receptor [Pseudomonadota bacterium]|nr:TonB-dependent receptor [Pseudomonadota bacterium]
MQKKLYLSVAALALATVIVSPAFAQTDGGEDASSPKRLQSVTVTARKTSEDIQDVPLSVSAFDAEALEAYGFTDSLDIDDQVPNLEIKTFGGNPNIFIRGVGNNDFNATTVSPVSIYSDDVVQGLTGGQLMQMFDLERVEVLRGPQGTLFGRNTTGGAINFYSRKPGQSQEGYFRVGVGNYNLIELEGAGTIVFSDKLATRVAGKMTKDDGYLRNLFNGERANATDLAAARMVTRYEPNDNLEMLWNVHMGRDRSDYYQGKPVGAINDADVLGYSDPRPDDPWVINVNETDNRHHADTWGTNLRFIQQFGDFEFKSITAYESVETDYLGDIDQSPNDLDELRFQQDGEQISQEFNLSYEGGADWSWIAGLFYLEEDFHYNTSGSLFGAIPAAALPLDAESQRDTTTYAVFGEATYRFTDKFSVTGGLRYTVEEKEATLDSLLVFGTGTPPNGATIPLIPETMVSDEWDAWSGRVLAKYEFTPDSMVYGSVSRGFRSGGFNLGAFFDPNELTTVDPEFLTSYELGLKTTVLDGRLRANMAVFMYDYTDLQVFTFTQGSSTANPIVIALENAANADVSGFEGEFTALPLDDMMLTLGVGYLDATYKDYLSNIAGDLSGNRLPGAPEWNINFAGQYDIHLPDNFVLTPRVEYVFVDQRYYDPNELEAISSRGSHDLFNARLTFRPTDANWQISLWGKNLADEDYIVDAGDLTATFGFIPTYYGERRRFGIEAKVEF